MNRKLLPAGTRFTRLTLSGLSKMDQTSKNRMYECVCDCGSVRWVQRSNLASGTTKSCGCLRTETLQVAKRKHKSPPPINEELESYKYSARKRKLSWALTQDEGAAFLVGNCVYCGIEPSREIHSKYGDSALVSGIDRIDSTKGYSVTNCVSCCSTCNYAKRDMSLEEWTNWMARLARFQTKALSISDAIFGQTESAQSAVSSKNLRGSMPG